MCACVCKGREGCRASMNRPKGRWRGRHRAHSLLCHKRALSLPSLKRSRCSFSLALPPSALTCSGLQGRLSGSMTLNIFLGCPEARLMLVRMEVSLPRDERERKRGGSDGGGGVGKGAWEREHQVKGGGVRKGAERGEEGPCLDRECTGLRAVHGVGKGRSPSG